MSLPEYNALILRLDERERRVAELEREFGTRQQAGPSIPLIDPEIGQDHNQRVINGIPCVISGDQIIEYFEEDNQLGNVIGMMRPDGTPEMFAAAAQAEFIGIRDMAAAFTDGQMIVHPLQRIHDRPILGTAWVGTYDADSNVIRHNGSVYTSINAFAMAHHLAVGSRCKTADGWEECFCAMGGNWVSTYRLGA